MKALPDYFEVIQARASQRWDQLEHDKELAGPWHQLFRQVQSPRHVLSELLQNADDAGATEASVWLEGQTFVFEHNGEDFSPDHFASLCRFGYSNKRSLHTIGFRGIGFKSTFSLGDLVQLYTPTLSVFFRRERFTEPHWASRDVATSGLTRVQVNIADTQRQRELEKNLREWMQSPVSLLFFRNIRQLRVLGEQVGWQSLGEGPIPDSEWMALDEDDENPYLLIRSRKESFPDETLREIRQERMLSADEETEFPPCRVELVLGAKGRLYVVLPTGVDTSLPFACNAPFIQDPARLKIKDPETSPTNRWLLERAGRLAASAMLWWLGQTRVGLEEQAWAYGLLPERGGKTGSLEAACEQAIHEAFAAEISEKPILLTEDGSLVPAGQSVIIPQPLVEVWGSDRATAFLDDQARPVLSSKVSQSNKQKLIAWHLTEALEGSKVLAILHTRRPPRPESWAQLLGLWSYVEAVPSPYEWNWRYKAKVLCIVPVQGKDELYPAEEVARLGDKRLLQSDEDWSFLDPYILTLNPNWPRFLAEQRRVDTPDEGASLREDVERAYELLRRVGLEESSDLNKVFDNISKKFFARANLNLSEGVRLAQIAAKLDVTAGSAFEFFTRTGRARSPTIRSPILFGQDGRLEELLPPRLREALLLHDGYGSNFQFCTREEWLSWVSSGKAGLKTFTPLLERQEYIGNPDKLQKVLARRSYSGSVETTYSLPSFTITDWDFEPVEVWAYWNLLAGENPGIWVDIARQLLSQGKEFWSQSTSARVIEVASNGRTRQAVKKGVLPSWVLKLRDLPCLPDTNRIPRKPGDLYRLNNATEVLQGVEPFLEHSLERNADPDLLDLLGVRATPAGPDTVLERLRALAGSPNPPVDEVDKWYRRLDRLLDTSSTEDFNRVKQAFRSERVVLTQDGDWTDAAAVYQSSDEEDVPGAALVRSSVCNLRLWHKVGVAERPTPELAIAWLKTLISTSPLPQEQIRRVKAMLRRFPARIWNECGHWLNLSGEWVPVEELSFALTMQSLVRRGHLHAWVNQLTADFQSLPLEATTNPPFSALPPLSAHIEERLMEIPLEAGPPGHREWLEAFGAGLGRVELEDEQETLRVRALARALESVTWVNTHNLQVLPYVAGKPAGTARQANVLWLRQEGRLLVGGLLPKAKLARLVPEEIGKEFGRSDVKAALDYSFERPAEDIREYLEENFVLTAAAAAAPGEAGGAATAHQAGSGTDATALTGEPEAAIHPEESPPSHENSGGPYIESPAGSDTPDYTSTDQQAMVRRARPSVPPRPSLIERFARVVGFHRVGEGRYTRSDGSWIRRADEGRDRWMLWSPSGELIRYYVVREHCLEREPLEIEAEVWGLFEQSPGKYSLILVNGAGDLVEFTGIRMLQMREGKEITLYPAAYRVKYNHEPGE